MQLERCKDQRGARLRNQSPESLDEFYEAISQGVHPLEFTNRDGAKAMLALISRLRALPQEPGVWGLTSHDSLNLVAGDTFGAPWGVRIELRIGYFQIMLLHPHTLSIGRAGFNDDNALDLVLEAMNRSGLWKEVVK